MKTGIIIIFHNNEKEIDISFFINEIKQTKNLELCLVNNNSKDNTYNHLKQISEECNNVSVVNIKKFKSDISAVKAGARFMSNNFNLNSLGYISTNLLKTNYKGLNSLIKAIKENQELINNYNIEVTKKQNIRLSLFHSLFSVIEYLKKLKVNNQFVTDNI